jgi:hypothetical protein
MRIERMALIGLLTIVIVACSRQTNNGPADVDSPPGRDTPPINETKGPRTMNLTWKDYDGNAAPDQLPEDAVYFVDGQSIGKGRKGFEEVVRLVEALPKGSKLVIRPRYSEIMLATPSGPLLMYPYDEEGYDDLCARIQKLADERRIVIDGE